jgi:hypothetical protein
MPEEDEWLLQKWVLLFSGFPAEWGRGEPANTPLRTGYTGLPQTHVSSLALRRRSLLARELVPAKTHISVLVQGFGPPDYNPRHWSSFHTELTLQPGEEQTLDIRLYRNPTP